MTGSVTSLKSLIKHHLYFMVQFKLVLAGVIARWLCFICGRPGGRSLRLMHAAAEDAGRYTCIVSNTAGEDRKNFDLDVLGNSTHTACFEVFCWKSFIVSKLKKTKNKQISTGLISDYKNFFVVVYLAVSFSLVPPSIVNDGGLQDVRVKEGQNITLTCEVTGMSSSSTTLQIQTLFIYLFIFTPVLIFSFLTNTEDLSFNNTIAVLLKGRFLINIQYIRWP